MWLAKYLRFGDFLLLKPIETSFHVINTSIMQSKFITTPVLKGYRSQGNCAATCFLGGCQIFEPSLRNNKNNVNPELRIFSKTILTKTGLSGAKKEFPKMILWLNKQKYEYLIVDPNPDESWKGAKKECLVKKIENTIEPPYSTKDVEKLAKNGCCVLVSTIASNNDPHAVLVYENSKKNIVMIDPGFSVFIPGKPESEYHWPIEQQFCCFENKYFLGNKTKYSTLSKENQNKADNRFLIAFKPASTPA